MDIRVILSIVGVCLSAGIALGTNNTLSPISRFLKQRGDDDAIIYFNIMAIGALLWPLVWYFTVGFAALKNCPSLLIAFVWPILLCTFQLYDTYYEWHEDTQDIQDKRHSLVGSIHIDSATVVSFAFAIGSLFWIIKMLQDKHNILPSVRLIIITLIVCIACIIPLTHFVNNNQRYTTVARVSQRIFVNYASGFIMSALIMVLSGCYK